MTKISVLGSGLMGPAAAFNALSDADISQVTMCDQSQAQLDAGANKLARLVGTAKLTTARLDLNDRAAAIQLMSDFDAVVAALPRPVNGLAIRAALLARTPLVDLTRPAPEQLPELETEAESSSGLAILACGVEPGLTEIMARHPNSQQFSIWLDLAARCEF